MLPLAHDESSQVEITQVWGDSVLRLSRFPLLGRVRIGTTRDCAFFGALEHLPGDRFPLIASEDGACWLQVTPQFEGELERDGAKLAIAALAEAAPVVCDCGFSVRRIPIEARDRVRLRVGTLTLRIRRVRPEEPIPHSLRNRLDYRFLGVVVATAAFFVVTGALFAALFTAGVLHAARATSAVATVEDLPILFQPPPTEPPPPPPSRHGATAAPGAHASGDPGKMGASHGSPAHGAAPPVRHVGIPGALASIDLNQVFGSGAATIASAIGDLTSGPDDASGSAGLGDHGRLHGGGGQALTIGLGDGGRGWQHGSCQARAAGCGPGDGDGTRREATLAIDDGETRVIGGLEPSVVDAHVKAHLAQLRWCYERELGAKPSLAGKVIVRFRIESDGRVSLSRIAGSTLQDDDVEGCLVERFQRIVFPHPAGGSTVDVAYPLLFRSET